MSLRLQSGQSNEPAPPELVTVVLSGFRNDLARHRVLAFVENQHGIAAAEIVLPFTVLDAGDAAVGTRLAGELNRLGAIVSLSRAAEIPVPAAPLSPAPLPPSPLPTWEVKPHRILGLLGSALRIPVMVFAGMALFSAFRLWMINRSDEQFFRTIEAARVAERTAIVEPHRPAESQRGAPALSINAIKSKLAGGDTTGALRAIQEALTAGDDAALLALQGDAYAKISNWDAARKSYERAVTRGVTDGKVYLALAGIYRQQGEQDQAVAMLHRAKENGAGGSEFESLVRVIKAEQDAESEFGAETSPHFTISFDTGEDRAEAQRMLTLLEDAYLVVGQKLGAHPQYRIPAVIYAARDFQEVTHSPGWAAALYDGRIKIPVRGARRHAGDIAATIRHEYTHALINTIAGSGVPVWLNEGVAMWAEEQRDGEREKWALGAIQLDDQMSLKQLERSFASLSGRQAIAAYARSYLAVRHIVSRYGQLPLRTLLEAFTTTKTTADAFRSALDVDLTVFEEDLQLDHDGT